MENRPNGGTILPCKKREARIQKSDRACTPAIAGNIAAPGMELDTHHALSGMTELSTTANFGCWNYHAMCVPAGGNLTNTLQINLRQYCGPPLKGL